MFCCYFLLFESWNWMLLGLSWGIVGPSSWEFVSLIYEFVWHSVSLLENLELDNVFQYAKLFFFFMWDCIWCAFFCSPFLSSYFFRALGYPRDKDGGCFQMRLSFSQAAPIFLFLVQWMDYRLAGALGLLRILIYVVQVLNKLYTYNALVEHWFCV